MTDVAREPAIVRGLLQPAAYDEPVDHVELRETHVSWVFLAGDRVYKIKKPVNVGFADFSTFEQRAVNCERELRLNRRLAPSVYLGLVDIVERDGAIHVGGPGRLLERAVKMKRLPDDGILSALLARGVATPSLVRRIARMIARFHAESPTGPEVAKHGDPRNIEAHWRGNFSEIAPFVGVSLPSWELAAIRAFIEAFLSEQRPLLDRRVATGRIRDGHGDLHADSICLVDGELVAFDCLEFADSYRCGDVAAETAFLAMDLDHAGRADLGWAFVDEYVGQSGDSELPLLLDFYRCYRAFVRGKVLSLRLAQGMLSNSTRDEIIRTARAYFDLALAYAGGVPRPGVVVVSGLPGTGKTTLARSLARRLGMVHIATDVERKRLGHVPPTDHTASTSGGNLYSAVMTRRTYAAVRARGALWLRRGVSVILDGTFTELRQRRLAGRLAARHDVPCTLVVTTADETEVRKRLEARAADPTNVSDATWEIYCQIRDSYPIPVDTPGDGVIVDPTGGAGADHVVEQLAAPRARAHRLTLIRRLH